MADTNEADARRRLEQLRKAISQQHQIPPTRPMSCRFFARGSCQKEASCPFMHSKTNHVKHHSVSHSIKKIPVSAESRLRILQNLLREQKGTNAVSMKSRYTFKAPGYVPPKPVKIVSCKSLSKPKPRLFTHSHSVNRSLNVNGVLFRLSPCGRSLIRSSSNANPINSVKSFIPSRVHLNGFDFIKSSSGSLVRSSLQSSRQAASSKLRRSLDIVRHKKLDKRKRQLCMFFCRFGFCKLAKECPFLHDTTKVAVCRTFVSDGVCSSPETCLLSHTVDRNKMPVCTHYLKGTCTKGDSCAYRHVKVNATAAICQDFLKGYCSKGDQCRLKHTYITKRKDKGDVVEINDSPLDCNANDHDIDRMRQDQFRLANCSPIG
uniref:C3H1-type domain-containing protein n=1 Tax=Spongospora subterranea TaxID=70186 RepID=A0A0H5QMP9_9EUKA|eukprot:CRZ02822.1 hypothetical protein [Spongospora subterranea]